jgi:DNA-directed RNA polymerase specialized sigma24 family protein
MAITRRHSNPCAYLARIAVNTAIARIATSGDA